MSDLIYSEVIIVGGGPAGSSCAYELKKAGKECIILDKEDFPRKKLCAGWVTPDVLKELGISADDYPHGILRFDTMSIHVFGIKKRIKTREYSIRRYEFDNFLLKRSGAKIYRHHVNEIKKDDGFYIIDGKFKCRYLVGAGGTFCPVYRTFFKEITPRANELRITAMEEEFKYDYDDRECHLWFFKKGLPGYAWYVPKRNGYINVGIGGKFDTVKDKGKNNVIIHWKMFTEMLKKSGLIKGHEFKNEGYVYFLRQNVEKCRSENAFIIGDSAGLATVDLGEGIGPAIQSGIICADAIANGKKFSLNKIHKTNLKGINSIVHRMLEKVM